MSFAFQFQFANGNFNNNLFCRKCRISSSVDDIMDVGIAVLCCASLCCCLKLATKSVSKLIETHIYCVEVIETRASCDKDRQLVSHSNRLKKNEFRWKCFWHEHRCTCWVSDGVKYKQKIATSVYIQIVHCLCIWVYVRRKRETTEKTEWNM